eukprot:CAMPEP_0184746572 /NCGR_PEP_ID=MMETSP0315-20130426/9103_1 /TAXON_ID=101924 /ORGANISM="Rhodosorus marinus, Strain UTEX LB 2760" /LENGTH=470 /DNA_ID=CAMNT_0027219209 /DNA_START=273 /DNA_END=1685 /DNA_ORIENTATION=+
MGEMDGGMVISAQQGKDATAWIEENWKGCMTRLKELIDEGTTYSWLCNSFSDGVSHWATRKPESLLNFFPADSPLPPTERTKSTNVEMDNSASTPHGEQWTELHLCGTYQVSGEALRNLLAFGKEFLLKEEFEEWLLRETKERWDILWLCARYQKKGETFVELLEYMKTVSVEKKKPLLKKTDEEQRSLLGICAVYQVSGEALMKLLAFGEEVLSEDGEFEEWLLRETKEGWDILRLCARYQKEDETFVKLLRYMENVSVEKKKRLLRKKDVEQRSLLGICAVSQGRGRALTKLLELGEKVLSGEGEFEEWLRRERTEGWDRDVIEEIENLLVLQERKSRSPPVSDEAHDESSKPYLKLKGRASEGPASGSRPESRLHSAQTAHVNSRPYKTKFNGRQNEDSVADLPKICVFGNCGKAFFSEELRHKHHEEVHIVMAVANVSHRHPVGEHPTSRMHDNATQVLEEITLRH